MLSLRSFHIFFIVVVVVAADLFAAWAIRDYTTSHDMLTLLLGIVAIIGSLGLVAYGIWFVNKMNRENIQ
ncbi:MAG: hypothetical protein AMXMBFR20_18420 [Planctomycetia bacterium]|jgi:hypothetical protein|nr:MAG: hypothetical protein B6D36_05070 [Planctomycetes bacterium UTPLA1]